MRKILIAALALLLVAPAIAAPTAVVSGTPLLRSGPGRDYPSIGRLPDGATVTLEHCTGEAPYPGMQRPQEGDWCLVRGAGWVDAGFLVGARAKVDVTLPDFLVAPPPALLPAPATDWYGNELDPQEFGQ